MRVRFVFPVLMLGACGPGGAQTQPVAETEHRLIGDWDIVAVDGRPPRSISSDPGGGERRPGVRFTATSYGGSTGCNSFGAIGLQRGDRYYGAGATMTQMGCGELTRQEDAITGVMASAPRIAFAGPNEARLTSLRGELTIRRATRGAIGAEEDRPPPLIAGTRWTVRAVDGVFPRVQPLSLRAIEFEAERWVAALPSCTANGRWQQKGGVLTLSRVTTPPDCKAGDAALVKALDGEVAFVGGPNGELVMAGAAGWLEAEFDRAWRKDDAAMLAGQWAVAGTRASLTFGATEYSADNGCNRSEGLFVAFGRQLTIAPGPSTLANCPGDRWPSVLGANARIARTPDGIALVSRTGRVRLSRLPGAPLRATAWRGLRVPLRAQLTSASAAGRLRLEARTFRVETACGAVVGDWSQRYMRFSGREERDGCAAARAFVNLLSGDIRAVTGANGELLIVGDHGKAVGQIER